jgi:hypothetical protein
VFRLTRPSIASSLCALSLVAAGCGESTTHSAAAVQRALARHGIQTERESTEPPREFRAKVSALSLRISLLLSYYGSRLAGLAEHKTHRWQLLGDNASVFVANDPQDAAWLQRHYPFRRMQRMDNLLVEGDNPRVAAALDDLR